MNTKYELTAAVKEVNGHTLHRIKALIDIRFDVKAGALGGWIEEEKNLGCDTGDNSWIYEGGEVWGGAAVLNNSTVYNSRVDNSMVYNSMVYNSTVLNNSMVYNSMVDNSMVYNSMVDKTPDMLSISPIGSRNAALTINFTENKIRVSTGCQSNISLEQFQNKVKETHGDNQYGKEYRAVIKFAKELGKIRGIVPEKAGK